MIVRNLLEGLPSNLPDELTEVLSEKAGIRIERIVSRGHSSPDDFWYDQNETEWILLVSGRARLQIEGKQELVELAAGHFLEIPAHLRHRVDWTDPDGDTVWLAVFCEEPPLNDVGPD